MKGHLIDSTSSSAAYHAVPMSRNMNRRSKERTCLFLAILNEHFCFSLLHSCDMSVRATSYFTKTQFSSRFLRLKATS